MSYAEYRIVAISETLRGRVSAAVRGVPLVPDVLESIGDTCPECPPDL